MKCDVCGREQITADTQNLTPPGVRCSSAFLRGCGVKIDVGDCYSLGYSRLLSERDALAKEVRDRDATHIMCNQILRDEMPALRAERDRLREALKAMLEVRPMPHSQLEVPVYVMARAALAAQPPPTPSPPKEG